MFSVVPSIVVTSGRVSTAYASHGTNPLAVAGHWSRLGVKTIHIEELPSPARELAPTAGALAMACRHRLHLGVGGGVHDPRTAHLLFEAGAGHLIVKSVLTQPKTLGRMLDSIPPQRLVAAMDLDANGGVRPGLDALASARRSGIRMLWVHGDFSNLQGAMILADAIRCLEDKGWQVWAGGGISDLHVLDYLADLGCQGAVVGRSLYDGRLDWSSIACWLKEKHVS